MKPATALPWQNDPTGDCGDEWIGRTEDSYYVAVCDDDGVASERTQQDREQDARYIVHACNLYPELVEALEELARHSMTRPDNALLRTVRSYDSPEHLWLAVVSAVVAGLLLYAYFSFGMPT